MLFALFLAGIAAGLEAFDGAADTLDALFNVALFGEGEAQAEVLLAAAVYMKRFADDESYPLARHFAQ